MIKVAIETKLLRNKKTHTFPNSSLMILPIFQNSYIPTKCLIFEKSHACVIFINFARIGEAGPKIVKNGHSILFELSEFSAFSRKTHADLKLENHVKRRWTRFRAAVFNGLDSITSAINFKMKVI